MENIITIEKVSDREYKRVETIPATPEQIIETVVSLDEVKSQLASIETDIVTWTGYRATPLAELAKIDGKIQELNDTKAKLIAELDSAKKKGVVATPIETVVVEETPVVIE